MARPKKPEDEIYIKFTLSFEPKLYQAIKEYCEIEDRPIAWLIDRSCRAWLKKHKPHPVDEE